MVLNRRSFIGGAVAAASASRIAAGVVPRLEQAGPQGSWVRRGLIDAGGTHESYLFVTRRGGQRLDARQSYDYEQSEALIQQLASQGVEVFHTHLYKGFGMEAEREAMEETRKAVEIVHRLGMKADTYIQWNSMMYETFFAEEPRAVHWIQRDIAGLPILLPYGYQQSFRYRPCFANQEYLTYLKKIVRYAVVDVKTNFIHFDNFDLDQEPDSCHCAVCVAGFRSRLKTKYTPAQRKERFGFEVVDYINPPQWNRGNPPSKLEIVYDPAFQEWIDFRCQLMADALEQMYVFVHSLNPEVAIEINPKGITGENRPWENGIDHARLLKFTNSFWSEEENPPGYHADGRLISKIRSYKLARTYSNVLLAYIEDNALAIAEALAFNQTLGFVGSNPLSPVTLAHIDFYRKNRDLYEASEDAGNVAVLRPYASLTYNNASVQLCTVLVEQALIQASVPFDLVFDAGLSDLTKYRVLILPNSECLSDAQLATIRRFVESGGALLVLGQAGLYDQWRRVRVVPGLQGLIDHQAPATEYQERVEASAGVSGVASRKQVGRGRVAYLPALEFDGPLPPATPNFAITSQFWKRPKNWRELTGLLQWASDERIPLALEAPEGIVANCTLQPARRRMLVHLVNYNVRKVAEVKDIRVQVLLHEGVKAVNITHYEPGAAQPRALDFTTAAPRTMFTVPTLGSYAVLAIAW